MCFIHNIIVNFSYIKTPTYNLLIKGVVEFSTSYTQKITKNCSLYQKSFVVQSYVETVYAH